jgi:uncharacterized membrane protein HdeD (DUF308 family)
LQDTVTRSTHDYWLLFFFEGVALIALGLLAVAIPLIAGSTVTVLLGWLFLMSGFIGLVTTLWARVGFFWSLVSALLGMIVGASLIIQRAEDLYGAS